MQVYSLDIFLELIKLPFPNYLYGWVTSFWPTLAAISSMGLVFNTLTLSGYSRYISFVTVLLVYVCTPISSLMTGGWVECYILLLLSVKLFITKNVINKGKYVYLNGITDFLIVALKFYAIIFIGLFFILKIRDANRTIISKYLLSFSIPLFLFIYVKLLIPTNNTSNVFGEFINFHNFDFYLINLMGAFFSLTFGLIFLPASLFILLNIDKISSQKNLTQTILPISFVLLFLCIYPFWHGALGVAGQRYIAPFLIFLSPLVAEVISKIKLDLKERIFFCLITVLYLNSIDYRNTLADVYANNGNLVGNSPKFAHENFPYFDPNFHPAIFGNIIFFKKYFTNDKFTYFKNSKNEIIPLDLKSVIPMSGISRAIYITSQDNPSQKFNSYAYYAGNKYFAYILSILKFLIATIMSAAIILKTSRIQKVST